MYKTTIYSFQPSDRNIVIVTDGDRLVGLNFWQDMGNMSIAETYLNADLSLTAFVTKQIQGLQNIRPSYSNPTTNLLVLIDNAICDWIIWRRTPVEIKLPKSQSKLIYDAVTFAIRNHCLNRDSHQAFDLLQLKALMSYEVSVKLTNEQIDSFTASHGVDFPEYIY
jgi:hypothetical protein